MTFPIHEFYRGQISEELWNLAEPPEVLYIQGSKKALSLLTRLPEDGLAVIGTRKPQPRSMELVKSSIHRLSSSRLVIVSGLARGVDTQAHLAAVQAGLPTIAILGAGLNINYPSQNAELRKKILEADGLLVSEFAPDQPPLNYHFLRRNRIIAGWAKASWVVEAAIQSGALNTARWSREQNRICFAVPCYPGDPHLAGNQVLLDRDHALPFWGIHSLGSVWIELATHPHSQTSLQLSFDQSRLSSDTHFLKLYHQIQRLTYEQGGVRITTLLDWASNQGWSSQQFFALLEEIVQQNLVIDQFGTLISTQS